MIDTQTGKLPTLNKGDITPLIARQFETACRNAFHAKDVTAEKQTGMVFGCFQDSRVDMWLSAEGEGERLAAMSFTDFMKAFRAKFLKPDWQQRTRDEVIGTKMLDSDTFDFWATSIQVHNSLLADT
ncbi:hypothetical protein B0H12DRAFT_1012312, partial [Mycena haematopus]